MVACVGWVAVAGAGVARADGGEPAARDAGGADSQTRAPRESKIGYRNNPLSDISYYIAQAGTTVTPPPKREHQKLIIGLSVAGAVLVVGAAAVGAVVGEQLQAGYHGWGTLGIMPH
jgi:hypothetical protein